MTCSPLIEAAKTGNVKGVRERLDAGDDINEKSADGDNALHWAAWQGQTEVLRMLIEHGADLTVTNSKDGDGGFTAAVLASRNKHAEAAQLLNAAAASPCEKWIGMGPASVALEGTYPGLKKRLTQVFNFESRERFILSENLRTKADAVSQPASFDDLPQSLLEKALAELTRLGGAADRDFVLHGGNTLDKTRKDLSTDRRAPQAEARGTP